MPRPISRTTGGGQWIRRRRRRGPWIERADAHPAPAEPPSPGATGPVSCSVTTTAPRRRGRGRRPGISCRTRVERRERTPGSRRSRPAAPRRGRRRGEQGARHPRRRGRAGTSHGRPCCTGGHTRPTGHRATRGRPGEQPALPAPPGPPRQGAAREDEPATDRTGARVRWVGRRDRRGRARRSPQWSPHRHHPGTSRPDRYGCPDGAAGRSSRRPELPEDLRNRQPLLPRALA